MSRFSTTISETPDAAEIDMTINHKSKSDKPEEAGGKGSSDAVNPAPGHPGLRNDPGESHKEGGVFVADGQPPGSVQDPTGEHGSPGPDPYRDSKEARKIDMSIPEWQRDQEFEALEKYPPAGPEDIPDPEQLSATTKAEMEVGRAAIGNQMPTPEHPDGGVGEGEEGAARKGAKERGRPEDRDNAGV
jgi:hypothetical protein